VPGLGLGSAMLVRPYRWTSPSRSTSDKL
jgi:hypothetical protein